MCSSDFKRISSLFLISFLWTLSPDGVQSQCVLKINVTNQPLLMKRLGSKTIILPKSSSSEIIVDDYNLIDAYCGSGFRKFLVYDNRYGQKEFTKNSKSLSLLCKTKEFFIGNAEQEKLIQGQILGCREGILSMYETRENLTNCEKYESYAMGVKLNTPIIQAGVCYDLENTNLKYVTFKLTNLSPILDKAMNSYPIGFNELSLTEPLHRIDNIFQFPSNSSVSTVIEKEAQANYWLRIANYELSNIVQTSSYGSEHFRSFPSYFNVIWWRNLLKGNWQQFTELLERRARTVAYNLFLGTSGTVRLPLANECLGEKSLEIELNDKKKTVPQFIWAYIQPVNETNSTDEIVAIAYNSPYFENFPKNSTVLCKDMCREIDWLKPMEISRSISTFGVMYFCRADEVVGLLDGFPLKSPTGTRTTVNP